MHDEMMGDAKLRKLKELREVLREILAEEGDTPMEEGRLDGAIEEADEAALEEPMGAELDDPEAMREGTEEEIAEPTEEDELAQMRREYFQPKASGPAPDRKGVAVAVLGPERKGLGDSIKLPKRVKRGLA